MNQIILEYSFLNAYSYLFGCGRQDPLFQQVGFPLVAGQGTLLLCGSGILAP